MRMIIVSFLVKENCTENMVTNLERNLFRPVLLDIFYAYETDRMVKDAIQCPPYVG